MVSLYKDAATLETAYKAIFADIMTTKTGLLSAPRGVGEDGLVSDDTIASSLVFRRCTAIVHMMLGLGTDAQSIAAYAKRLDARLQPLVCEVK